LNRLHTAPRPALFEVPLVRSSVPVYLRFYEKRSGSTTTCLWAQSWRTFPSHLSFHFNDWRRVHNAPRAAPLSHVNQLMLARL